MKKIVGLIFAASLSTASLAQADFYTYSQWADLSEAARSYYIAGAFDVVSSYSPDGSDQNIALLVHYQTCMSHAKMTRSQLSENVKMFAATRPKLQSGSATFALLSYLYELCGTPPEKSR
jgi:hypothetical protein